MIEILQNTMLIIVFIVVIRYIKNNNLTLSDLRSREQKTEQELKQLKEFKEIMKKEKNKLRY
jgi:cell division protein FtsB